MKAAVIEAVNQLVVREVPEPVMGDYDCLCEGLYGATCSGTDLHLMAAHPLFGITFPTILGHESIGRVIEVGPKVEVFKVGDVVTRLINRPTPEMNCHWGGFAERGLVTDQVAMQRDGVISGNTAFVHNVLPTDFDPAGATMMITWRETFSYYSRLKVPVGAKVLIMGSGGNGLSYAAHAANLLASSVVMVGSPAREETGRAVGATDFIDYRTEDLVAEARRRGLDQFDLILDAIGKIGQLDRVLPLLKSGGTATIYGVDDYGKVTITPQKVSGSFTFANPGYMEGDAHDAVVKLMRRGLLKAEHFCDLKHIYPLDDINAAFDAVRQRRVIKAVVKLS
ncbi:MAG: zinc-binding dehydrogenase [Armatimonadota bacterium]